MMSAQLARASTLYNEARLAEEHGNIDRAEVLYVESMEIFLHAGGEYWMDAVGIMHVIARMKEANGDREGASRALEKLTQILDRRAGELTQRR